MSEAGWVVVIDARDPCLEGHFPGNPLVPGVVLLERVFKAIQQRRGAALELAGVPNVKFTHLLRPGEPLSIEIEELSVGRLQFCCHVEGRRVAAGVIEVTSPSRATA